MGTNRSRPTSASSPSPTFTLDELLAAMQAAPASVPGLSVTDICQQTGQPRARVSAWLRQAVPAGRVRCSGRVMRPAVDGTMRPVPVYVPVRAA
jgi:predicted Rossmann fold nucleotide-binding protein DprA/Smf involved in DNA uptake